MSTDFPIDEMPNGDAGRGLNSGGWLGDLDEDTPTATFHLKKTTYLKKPVEPVMAAGFSELTVGATGHRCVYAEESRKIFVLDNPYNGSTSYTRIAWYVDGVLYPVYNAWSSHQGITIVYLNSTFIVGQDEGNYEMLVSTDNGSNWYQSNQGTGGVTALIFVSPNFIQASSGGLFYGTSANLAPGNDFTFAGAVVPSGMRPYDIVYDGTRLIVCGSNTSGPLISYSTAAISAASWTTSVTGTSVLRSLAYKPDRTIYLAAGDSNLYRSTNGTAWSVVTGHGLSGVVKVFWHNKCFTAVGTSGIFTSTDGLTWTQASSRSIKSASLHTNRVSVVGITTDNKYFEWDGNSLTGIWMSYPLKRWTGVEWTPEVLLRETGSGMEFA